HTFHDTYNVLPVAAHWCTPFYTGSKGFPGQNLTSPNGMVHGTWLSDILPYIEQGAAFGILQKAYAQSNGAGETAIQQLKSIATFVCPSDPSSGTDPNPAPNINQYNFGSTNYYGNVMVFRINAGPAGLLQAMPDGTSNSVIIVERYQRCDGDLSGGY